MTPKQMVEEIKWIKNRNEVLKTVLKIETNKKKKAECRAQLRENYHQLCHLESTLLSIKYDPNF